MKNYFGATTKEKMLENTIINDYHQYPMPFYLECLLIIIQIGCYILENLKNHWSTKEQFLGPFYRKTRA
jgi:hypothetical protein